MKNIANFYNGECLSTEYINTRTKLLWKCQYGHCWKAPSSSIRIGRWCPYCAGRHLFNIPKPIRKKRLTKEMVFQKIQEIAKVHGGKCLSTEYIHHSIKLLFECKNGHQWMASPNHIKSHNSWCPHCPLEHIWGYKEKLCRQYFEYFFPKHKFFKTRPVWLKRIRKLELDGYNKELNLAFEYNGRQHYEYNNLFHTQKTFVEQQERDNIKKELCNKQGVKLITIPYNISKKSLARFIFNKCQQNNINPIESSLPVLV